MPGMRRQYCIWEAGQEILLRDLQKQVQQQENEENQGDEVQDHVCPGEELQHIGRPVENECDRGLCPAAEAARLQFRLCDFIPQSEET